ncbi:MAG: tetratricopeptide repeat protein [Actinomycetia bacterium]|nr:tetratricopeptide repeat protein [Actinomycetes bacterium]
MKVSFVIAGNLFALSGGPAVVSDGAWRRHMTEGAAAVRKGAELEAEENFQRAIAEASSPHHGLTKRVLSLRYLAILYVAAGRNVEAAHVFENALAIVRSKRKDVDAKEQSTLLIDAAMFFNGTRRLALAAQLYREWIELGERLWGDAERLADGHRAIAGIMHSMGRAAEAEDAYRRVIAIMTRKWGESSLDVAAALSSLADFLTEEGRLEDAQAVYREMIRIHSLAGGPVDEAALRCDLALLLSWDGKEQAAEEEIRRAEKVVEGSLGPGHEAYRSVLRARRSFLLNEGRFEEAENLSQDTTVLEVEPTEFRGWHLDEISVFPPSYPPTLPGVLIED